MAATDRFETIDYDTHARPEEIQRARDEYQTDDVEIDDGAKVSRGADGGFWVAAWVWLPDAEEQCSKLTE